MIKAIENGIKVRGWEIIGWFGSLNYREAVSYTSIYHRYLQTRDMKTIYEK